MESGLYILIVVMFLVIVRLIASNKKLNSDIKLMDINYQELSRSNRKTHQKLGELRISLANSSKCNTKLSIYNSRLRFTIIQSARLIELAKIRLISYRDKERVLNMEHINELTKVCTFMKCNSKES